MKLADCVVELESNQLVNEGEIAVGEASTLSQWPAVTPIAQGRRKCFSLLHTRRKRSGCSAKARG